MEEVAMRSRREQYLPEEYGGVEICVEKKLAEVSGSARGAGEVEYNLEVRLEGAGEAEYKQCKNSLSR